MEQINQNSDIRTLGILLRLKRQLMNIDSIYQPKTKKLAEQAINAIPVDITEKEKKDFLRNIMLENFDSFSVLSVELSTFLKEIKNIRENFLNQAIVSAIDGNNTINHVYAQSVELLKESAFMLGYLSQWETATTIYREKIPFGKFWYSFIKHLREKTEGEYKKSHLICSTFLRDSAKESPRITDIIIDFDPLLGYDTNDGFPDDYSQFRTELGATLTKWFYIGLQEGSEKYRVVKKSLHVYDYVV